MPIVSIMLGSNRPENLTKFFAHINNTISNPANCEILVKLDDCDEATIAICKNYSGKVRLKYLATPRLQGYYTLHKGYAELFKIVDSESYFWWNLTDEIRIETPNWDEVIKKYIGFVPGDLFCLRMSLNKVRNYYHLRECFIHPENYSLITTKWLNIVEGWGDIWGPDAWQQAIHYHLGRCVNPYLPIKGVFRSLPIYDLTLSGEEAGGGLTTEQLRRKTKKNKALYKRMCGLKPRKTFLRLAQKINAYLWKDFYTAEHPKDVVEIHEDKSRCHWIALVNGKSHIRFSYSWLQVLKNGYKKPEKLG